MTERLMPRTAKEVLAELREILRARAVKRGLAEGSADYNSFVFGTYNREKDRILRKHQAEPMRLQREMDAAKKEAQGGHPQQF